MEDWLRALWNGPFYIGKLERPVSVGDVLMKLLETAWRAGVIFVSLIAAVVAFSIVADKREARARLKAEGEVQISATVNTAQCPRASPIYVRIGNPSDRRMASIYYSVVIQKGGRDIAPPHFRYRKIEGVDAGKGRVLCLSPWRSDTGDVEVLVGDLEPDRVYGTITSASTY